MKTEKRKLRKDIRARLACLPPEDIGEKSKIITGKIIRLKEWKEADIVLLYLPMECEADTLQLIHTALAEGKDVAVPRMRHGNIMYFHFIENVEGPWQEHEYGIKEPHPDLPVLDPNNCPDQKMFMIVPGLAFDRSCNRLGRGKGFYDRYLSMGCENLTAYGICFDDQLVDKVPTSDHDRKVDGVVTEKEIIVP